MRYLQCNFARVIASAIPFFRKCGYQEVGALKAGKRYSTQVMVKSSLMPLAGRIARLLEGKHTTKKERPSGRRRRTKAKGNHG